jgi:hypothetical protein
MPQARSNFFLKPKNCLGEGSTFKEVRETQELG